MLRFLKPRKASLCLFSPFSNVSSVLTPISYAELHQRISMAKIVATIGPSSEQLPELARIVESGMRIMRINFSHATYEEANLRMKNLKLCLGLNHPETLADKLQLSLTGQDIRSNIRSVMLDTQGPEIRTGSFGNGVKEIELVTGKMITLTTDDAMRYHQTADTIWVSYQKLFDTVRIGSLILLDDGAIEIEVVEKVPLKTTSIGCKVLNQGMLGNKKGVNMPGLVIDLPAMSEKDKEDIKWGVANDIDCIAASFVRKASDVTEIRDYVRNLLKLNNETRPPILPLIVSKIESVEALENFDSILEVSDAIMVARGDLAVEIPMESLTQIQKAIVQKCNAAGKPVVVATQMLESMQKNPRPTRAECTDVSNAVLDGADCVMLSGESAKGKYPIQSVAMMKRIVDYTELSILSKSQSPPVTSPLNVSEAAACSAVQVANHPINDVYCIIVGVTASSMDQTSSIPRLISKYRPHVPVFCLVPDHKTGRILQLHRGLHPVLITSDKIHQFVDAVNHSLDDTIVDHIRRLGFLSFNDQVKGGSVPLTKKNILLVTSSVATSSHSILQMRLASFLS